jgi:signal transduction histidine kinase
MSERNPRVMAAVIAAAIAASLLGTGLSLRIAAVDGHSMLTAAFNAAVVTAFTVVGAVVAAARPRNRVGWAMVAGGVLWSLGNAAADIATHGIVADPGSVSGVAAFVIGGQALRGLSWFAVTLLVPALFPDGVLRERRWRWLRPAFVLIAIGAVLDPLFDGAATRNDLNNWQNPVASNVVARVLSGLAFLVHLPLSLVATVGVVTLLVHRWRRGTALQRQQLTMFAFAAALPIIAAPIGILTNAGGWIFGLAALPLPFAIGFAVLARGLYDIRTATNRTLVWVMISAVIAAIYALFIVGTTSVLHVSGDVVWLPWAAAAIVAVLFAPVRDGLQRAVNRLTFGRWDEPYDVLADLGQRLEATVDVDRLLEDVAIELQGLGLRDIEVRDTNEETVAGGPSRSSASFETDLVTLPLAAYGQPVGSLRYRPPPTPLRARDRRLLDDLAGHVGGVLHARRLRDDLQGAVERLVLAREEERRRLRRDLHDGLGPALAGHLLRLDVIAGEVDVSSPAARDIDMLRVELRTTITELRRVVEGLRPPALDELGLSGALTQVTQRLTIGTSIEVDLSVDDLPALPAAMEVAAFRIVTEAVTNTVRHSSASSCRARISADDSCLRITISDDGQGFNLDGGAFGHGLQTMRERAEELGGQLQVSNGSGVTITASLPLP